MTQILGHKDAVDALPPGIDTTLFGSPRSAGQEAVN